MKKANDAKIGHRAMSPRAREDQLISLAVDLAEKQLREGTASPSVIAHFLKMGSSREYLEKQKLSGEIELTDAKTEAIQSTKRIEELYSSAISAMQIYSGQTHDEE